jgi:hypothetical protein
MRNARWTMDGEDSPRRASRKCRWVKWRRCLYPRVPRRIPLRLLARHEVRPVFVKTLNELYFMMF